LGVYGLLEKISIRITGGLDFSIGSLKYQIVIPKRGRIARGICCLAAKSRFLADKAGSE
jgi:hypothetical protein